MPDLVTPSTLLTPLEELLNPGSWIVIGDAGSSFGTGWGSDSTQICRARLNRGRVEVEGRFQKASFAAGETVFFLPTVARPDHIVTMRAYLAGGLEIRVLTISKDTGAVAVATSGSTAIVVNDSAALR